MLRDHPTPSHARPATERRAGRPRGFPAGTIAATAVLASLAGTALWLHLLAGPVRLATGLLDASRHLDKAGDRLSSGAIQVARYETYAGSGGVERARASLDGITPLLDVLDVAPVAGPAMGEIDHLVKAAEHSETAARGTLDIAESALRGPNSIIERSGPGTKESRINVERVAKIGDEVVVLREEVRAVQEELSAVDLDDLPKRFGPRIDRALRKAKEAEGALNDADAGFTVLPGILGADEPRNYLIGFQNSAEARGTGGAILQFRVLEVDDGRVDLAPGQGSIYAIDENRRQLDIPLPSDAWYQAGIPDARRFGNANWSPDFPLAAELLLGYAYASDPTFPQVDGVIGVAPKAMEELIPALGSLKVDGTKIGRDDIVRFVLNEQYGRYPFPEARRRQLKRLVGRFYKNLFDPKKPFGLLQGMSDSLSGKHMQIWMKDPEEQRFIERMGWDGAIEKKGKSDFLYIVEQNVGGNKFDFFDEHENRVEIALQGQDALTSTSIAVTNDVTLPQPRWVMGDSGGDLGPLHRPMMVLYTRPDTELNAASVDGTRVDAPDPAVWPTDLPPSYLERSKKAWPVTMEVLSGQTTTAHFDYRVPGIVRTENGRRVYRLTVQHQPKVRPEWLSIALRLPEGARDVSLQGWKRSADRLVWEGELKRDMTLEVSWRE